MSWYYFLYQKVFAFIDVLLVIGMATIFSIAGFVVYQQISEHRQADQEISNLKLISKGVKKTFTHQSNYEGLTTGLLNQAHVFPRSMNANNYSATQEITHSEGGLVEVKPYGKHHQYFSITYSDVSPVFCIRLVQSEVKNDAQVKVGGALVKDFANAHFDPALMLGQCNATNHLQIQFIYK